MSGSGRSTSNEPLVVSWEARKTADMIRTINEHYRAAKLLCQKAESAPKGRRKLLLQLAKLNLMFAKAQLRDPSLRPKARLSADQCRAIAEALLAKEETALRGRWFAELAEIAERYDWPSSRTAPFQRLSKAERSAICNSSFSLCQRVFAPTATEQASLRQNTNEVLEWRKR
jgi:hypothetical protein